MPNPCTENATSARTCTRHQSEFSHFCESGFSNFCESGFRHLCADLNPARIGILKSRVQSLDIAYRHSESGGVYRECHLCADLHYTVQFTICLYTEKFAMIVWEGCRESRRCSRDTYPESYIAKYTSIQRLVPRINGLICDAHLVGSGGSDRS